MAEQGAFGAAMMLQTAIVTTAVDGTYTWTFAAPFEAGVVPTVIGVAQMPQGNTDVVNVQLDGAPTNTQARLRVTRSQQSVVGLLGLTILSIPASVGAVTIHVFARPPAS